MAVATTMSESEFKSYLDTELGPVANALGWTTDSDYDEALDDALNMAGQTDIDDIATAEGVDQIRILGMLAIWRRVEMQTAGDYDHSADGLSTKRSQFNAQAKANVLSLESRSWKWIQEPIKITSVAHQDDPYEFRTDKDRPL